MTEEEKLIKILSPDSSTGKIIHRKLSGFKEEKVLGHTIYFFISLSVTLVLNGLFDKYTPTWVIGISSLITIITFLTSAYFFGRHQAASVCESIVYIENEDRINKISNQIEKLKEIESFALERMIFFYERRIYFFESLRNGLVKIGLAVSTLITIANWFFNDKSLKSFFYQLLTFSSSSVFLKLFSIMFLGIIFGVLLISASEMFISFNARSKIDILKIALIEKSKETPRSA